jgi:IS4 transposase
LRDIEACLRAHSTKLYHLGIRGNVARNTLANANATRDWRIYCDFAQRLIGIARRLYTEGFEAPLRRIKFNDPETGKRLVFLTNNFALPALTVAQLYRPRWRVELFFKWIKQRLRIKAFFGTTENAVKTQIWIAVSVYILIAIVKKRLSCSASLYEMLQILSLTMFERTPINQLLSQQPQVSDERVSPNQLSLFA